MSVASCLSLLAITLVWMVFAALANFPMRFPNVPITESGCTDDSSIIQEGKKLVVDTVDSQLREHYGPPCFCKGTSWKQFYYMNDSNAWTTCNSKVTVPCQMLVTSTLDGGKDICGRIKAIRKLHQPARSYAFENYLFNGHNTTEKPYVDGISITFNGDHVWTFAVPQDPLDKDYKHYQNCDCSRASHNWPYRYPDFVKRDFFCDANDENRALWSGDGCDPESHCCDRPQYRPPWFCTSTPNSRFQRPLVIKHFGDVADIVSIEIYI